VETLEPGGAEGLAVEIARSLAARGHQSHLIVMDGSGPFRSRLGEEILFHDLEFPRPGGSSFANLLHFRKTYRALAGIVAEHGIDVVQTHLPKANFLGLILGRNTAAKVFPTVHNNREFDYGEFNNRLKSYLRKRAYRLMLSWCDGMIAVSDQVRTAMIGELNVRGAKADRIAVVPNGVAVPTMMDAEEIRQIRGIWSVDEDEVLLVGVGRLTHQKNFSSLLDALALVPATAGKWKCVIAGEGEHRSSLEDAIKAQGLSGRIVLAGHVPEVGRLLGAADVFCLSSRYEGLPLVLLEAMAAGLPVCAYGIDGVTDVVQEGVQAVLAKPEDAQDLARAIGQLLENQTTRREMGAAGRALVEKTYNFERVIDQLEELYQS
jgi:glycosyltransferase involved in cell wall biosynthesis